MSPPSPRDPRTGPGPRQKALDIPRFHGSYEELLGDPEIEAVYIRCPIISIRNGRLPRPRPESTCCARSHSQRAVRWPADDRRC